MRACFLLGALPGLLGTLGEAQSRTVAVGDARLHYEVAGSGSPVVFIHGWANDLRTWDDQFMAFAKRYRAIRYDRRGSGRSTSVPDLTADPTDLAVLLDTLGISAAHIVGHSAGGRVAIAFAVAFPERVRGLVLFASGPPSGLPMTPEEAGVLANRPALARQLGLDSLGKLVMAMPAFHIPKERQDLRQRIDAMWSAYSGRDLLEDLVPSGRTPPASLAQLASVRAPTLIVVGDGDLALLHRISDTLAVRISGAQRVTIPGGGHVVHMLQPERFNRTVMTFLTEVDRRR